MKKIHKRLLGVGGLALVAAITTVAYNIPDVGAVSASAQVDINVSVVGQNPEIRINSPLDGAKLTTADLHIVARYEDADSIEYTLSSGDRSIIIPAPDLSGNATETAGNSGEHDFVYNLKDFDSSKAGYGTYTLKVVVKRGSTVVEDAVSFSYYPASVNDGSVPTDENNNPIVDINVKPSVVKVMAIVEKADGTEAFRVTSDTDGTSPLYMVLPFSEDKNLDSGTYVVKFITYSYNGLGELVADQSEDSTNLVTRVTYEKKAAPTPPPDVDPPAKEYEFVDSENEHGLHNWNRNSNAGESLRFVIKTDDAYDYFNANAVYLTTAANSANLFNEANILNPIYFTAEGDGLKFYLKSSYLATLPSGNYILGLKLKNGMTPTAKFTISGKTANGSDNPNPVIDVNVEEGVEMVEVIVYDKNGKEIFRFQTPVTDITTNHITLPFDIYDLGDGDYLIAVIPYVRGDNGKLIPLITEEEAKENATKIGYGAPRVPNTGDFFSALNLSKKDYLLTGLIIFGAVTAGSIALLRKKETRR